MDEVKLVIPASSKFLGSEGFGGAGGGGGGVGVAVMEVEGRESDRISIVVASSIDRYSSAVCQKAEMSDFSTSQSSFWDKMSDTELRSCTNQISSFSSEEAPEELKFRSRNNSALSMPSLDGKQVQRKSGKVARSSSGCAKRSRVAQMKEVTVNEAEADDIKVLEKNQTAKQRNAVNGKRGDKRNGKVAMKGKYDYLSLKAGMVGFNSGAGGNNFLGAYGLKPDTYDVTKHLDELSVNELLDGSYKGPSFTKDKGKKSANLNENVAHSVRKALSILRLHRRLHSQNSSEIDSSCNWKISTCPVSADAPVASRNAGDKGDTSTVHWSSYDKVQDSLTKNETPANVLDFQLCEPKEILERLALPPPKDLDSLLLDAAKPTVLKTNNSDSRGKQISQRAGLSPFPWSHNSGGHCKASTDAIKLSVSRTTCQGRWVKIGNTCMSPEGGCDFVADLESLTKDNCLVALKGPKSGSSESEIAPATSVSFPLYELGSSSSAAQSIASQLPRESGSSLKCEIDAGHSPRLLVAAQTLYDISSHSLKQHGMVRWPKKPSEKTMKACKSKSDGKSGEIFAAPKTVIATDDQVKNINEVSPFKKPRLLNKDLGPNIATKAPINWSTQRSSRPPPGKSFRDPIVETKQYNDAHVVKQSGLMPPPPVRVSDKACNSRQKLLPVEWNREAGR